MFRWLHSGFILYAYVPSNVLAMFYLNSVYGSVYVPSLYGLSMIQFMFCRIGFAICRLFSVYVLSTAPSLALSMSRLCSVHVLSLFLLYSFYGSVYVPSTVLSSSFFQSTVPSMFLNSNDSCNIGMLPSQPSHKQRMGLDVYCSDKDIFIHPEIGLTKTWVDILSVRFLLSGHKPGLHLPLRVILVSFTSHSSFSSCLPSSISSSWQCSDFPAMSFAFVY